MAVATAFLVQLASAARDRKEAALALFLIAMMAEMFVSVAVYLRAPGPRGLVEGVAAGGALMAATAAGLFFVLSPGAGPADPALPRVVPFLRPAFLGSVVALLLLNEALMAWTFGLIAGSGPVGGPDLVVVARLLLSRWFVFPMAAEMALATVLLWPRLGPGLRAMLPLQAAVMALSAPTLPGAAWANAAVLGGSAAMIALFVYQLEFLYRHRELTPAFAAYFLGLIATYAAMMAGLYLWLEYGTPVLIGLSLAAEMVVYFAAVLSLDRFRAPASVSWGLRPGWATAVLSLVFVAELFMGAALDLRLDPSAYAGLFAFPALSGGPAAVVRAGVANGFWFFATATASTGFLGMMGLEMGALVAMKMRETRHLENRIRLALMIGCYGAFAVFYPSLYFGLAFPQAPPAIQVPVLGWSMGVGSYPLAAGVFGVLLVTYAITGALVVLFGRRVVCSVFCTAPLMYQGTTIDAMKSFNRSSPIARKYLSSRLSGLYGTTTAVVMGSLVVASLASYLDSVGALSVSVLGSDPSVFLFMAYFSVLWYVMFVTIPFTGNYNCVTMGWCYTGTIAQAFQKVGFFKLKVKSREVCRACTTLDCAKGCPVGLVDMPGHFRRTGEFRSSKCCGVGECVEACPYDNLYVADVRHWIRRRLGRPEPSFPPGVRLPMAGAVAPSAPARGRPTPGAATVPGGHRPAEARSAPPAGSIG
jgi:polyferredoxin